MEKMSKKRKANDDSMDEVSRSKRNRSKPNRYDDTNFEQDKDKLHGPSHLRLLTSALKSWSERNLTLLSYSLQWDLNLSTEELAAIVEKEPEQVRTLLKLIRQTRWDNQVLKKTLGNRFFLPNDNEHAASESLLDFWRFLCTSLTPASLNNSSEIAVVIKDIALSSDKEFRPIYEYIAMALDDPVSTLKSHPSLSPMQCGMILEILHSLATETKQHHHLRDYLHERALAALLGDWDALKMPEPKKESDKRILAKRVSLQSLNPFNMSKASVPPIVIARPPGAIPDPQVMPSEAVPLKAELRPMKEMAKMHTGYKTVIIRKKQKAGRMNPSLRKLKGSQQQSVDLDHIFFNQINTSLDMEELEEEEEEDSDEEDEFN